MQVRLDDVHTPDFKHVVHLKDKLEILYGYHPFIKTQALLAKELGIAASTLSVWLNGRRMEAGSQYYFTNPASIPQRRFPEFCAGCGVSEETLLLENLEKFRDAIGRVESNISPWDHFVRGLTDTAELELIQRDGVGRGIVPPDDEEGLPRLDYSDGIMFRIETETPRYLALLVEDRMVWQCVWPRNGAADPAAAPLIYPREKEGKPRYGRFDMPGIYRAVAIVTDAPLPGDILRVMTPGRLERPVLDSVAARLQALHADGHCTLLSRRFVVVTRDAQGGI